MVNSHNRFVWYELMTTDVAAAGAFYTEVMGWGAQDASLPGMGYVLFTNGKAAIAGAMDLPEEAKKIGAMPRWIGYVGVNDVDATVERVKRLGGAVQVPPKDISNISRFSVLSDPQLATFALFKWLNPGQQKRAGEPGGPAPVSWHELLAADWEKAFAFYSDVFGWEKADADIGPIGSYLLFSAGGQKMGGMFTKPAMVPVPFWLYYFSIGDIDAAVARVKAGGGQILEGPLEVPGGSWIARCTDPQGAVFALEGGRGPDAARHLEHMALRNPADARGRLYWWIDRR